jgi:chemotaxis methyl-accepting protein methylase
MTAHDSFWPPNRVSYRHVVFSDDVEDRGRAFNFAREHSAPSPRPGQPLSSDERSFVTWLFEQAGLCARHYRQETILRRLPACLRLIRVPSVRDARRTLELNRALIPAAVDALVIGVTSFFRDEAVFTALADRILPELLQNKPSVRIWSVGCSDGQEMYSVIMLLAELGWLNRAALLGTDCRVQAVRRAAEGNYSDADVRTVPSALLRKHFTLNEWGWRVDARLRTVVQWRVGDVLQVDEPGTWDMILCRNMAMYLEPEIAHELWQHLYEALGKRQILITGKAERPGEGFVPLAPCIYRRI